MKKLDVMQMENLQGGDCKSITLFGFGYHWGSNAGEGEPIRVRIGTNEDGDGIYTYVPSPNTCPQGWF